MVNLVSEKQHRALIRLYLVRLLTTVGVACAVVGGVTVVLLLPSYFTIHAEADQAHAYVDAASKLATERAKSGSPETLQRFHEEVTQLTGSARPPSFAHILSLLTLDRPGGVYLSNITVTNSTQTGAEVSLEGVANTRAALIAYANALKKIPEFSDVVVPVSALVADVDSAFSLTLHWTKPAAP